MVFIQGIRAAMVQWRLTAIVYFLQFCLALTVGMQVYDVLHASIGQSLELKKLLYAYDHTVVTDFLKVHGASITPLIGQLRWLLLVWILFSVFTNGGLLYAAAHPEAAAPGSFWQHGARYFWQFLGISLVFWLLTMLWTILLFAPVALYFQDALESFPSEKYVVWMVLAVILVWFWGVLSLFVWSVVARLQRLRGQAARRSLVLIWHKKALLLRIMLAFILFQSAAISLYWWLEGFVGMVTPLGILVVFLLQQLFVFYRIQLRQALYVSITTQV